MTQFLPYGVSIFALVVSCACLVYCMTRKPPQVRELTERMDTIERSNADVKTAFRKLEQDCEDQWERVNKGLGRYGRLKAIVDGANLASANERTAGSGDDVDSAVIGGKTGPSVHVDDLAKTDRSTLLRIARQRGILSRPA